MRKEASNSVENIVDFLYQETEIHFLVHPGDKNVMVNATEMAKVFGKRTSNFLVNKETKDTISALERTGIPVHSDLKIVDDRGHMGIYFHRLLAIDFASWLNKDFKVWILLRIDEVVFGNYKEHWDAHVWQESQKKERDRLELKLSIDPTPEDFKEYLKVCKNIDKASRMKERAIKNQLKLF
ncbi:hypothetical protein LCGC14_1807360 [marine sediment metagenome]|uniref:KilA-N domain-containing protein n=2 Tax=root TaxID=1 RepID=A0A831QKF5_9FLAO|nr:KilA-N domain-containing protein [Pricia antarctica]